MTILSCEVPLNKDREIEGKKERLLLLLFVQGYLTRQHKVYICAEVVVVVCCLSHID